MNLFLRVFFLSGFHILFSINANCQWEKTLECPLSTCVSINDEIEQTDNGLIIHTFDILGSFDFSILNVINPFLEGESFWSRDLLGITKVAFSLITTDDFIYVLGITSEPNNDTKNLAIVKYDYNGVLIWDREYFEVDLRARSTIVGFAQNNDEVVVISPRRNDPESNNPYGFLQLSKIDEMGDIIENEIIEDTAMNLDVSDIIYKDDLIYIVGKKGSKANLWIYDVMSFLKQAEFDLGSSSNFNNAKSIQSFDNGLFVLINYLDDRFSKIYELDFTGNVMDSIDLVKSDVLELTDMSYDENQGLCITGVSFDISTGVVNSIVGSVSEDLVLEWTRNYPIHSNEIDNSFGASMIHSRDGGYYFLGDLDYFEPGRTDAIVANLNVDGFTNVNEITTFQPQIGLFPNPTTDIINIESDLEIESVSMFDSSFKLIDRKNENLISLSLSGLQKGMYFLQFNIKENIVTKKIVKN